MKQSEIKHSLEKIHWAFLGVKDMIDRPKDILSEHLQMLSDETKAALNLVIALCDYMIDDGETDLTEDLNIIHDEATKITNGVYGRVPEDAKTDERQPIIAEILINVANMWVEIQHYWDWVEATPAQQGETPPPPVIQEQRARKQPGARKTTFADFVEGFDDEDCKNKIVTLHTHIDNKQPAQAALIIAAAIEADWISIKVTAPSIEREFGISEASIKPHLRKFRAQRGSTTPYYTSKELQPYIDLFKG